MTRTTRPFSSIRWAILNGEYSDNIARVIQHSLRIFQIEPRLYDSPGLQGPAKRAELVVKLGYWHAVGHLSACEFEDWVTRIPPTENRGWDIDLVPRQPGSVLPWILKMGPTFPLPEESSAQEA